MCDTEGMKTCKRLAPTAGTPNLPLLGGKGQVRGRGKVSDSFTVVWHWTFGVENLYLHISFEITCLVLGNVIPVPQNCKNSPQGSDLPTWKQFCAGCAWEKESDKNMVESCEPPFSIEKLRNSQCGTSGLCNSAGALGAPTLSSPGERGAHREGDQHPDPSLPSLRVFRSCSQAPSASPHTQTHFLKESLKSVSPFAYSSVTIQ